MEARESGSNQYRLRYGVASVNSLAGGLPTITGTVQVGEALSADTSGIIDGKGLTGAQYGYQWVRGNGSTDTDITGATGSTYTLTDDDLAHTIKVRVNFTDDDGYAEELTSAATGTVNRPPNATRTGLLAVTGTVQVGETLSVDTSGISDANGMSNPQYGYQWTHSVSGTDADISGATGSTYTIVSGDAGNGFKVRVSFTDDDGYSESVTSDVTDTLLVTEEQEQTSAVDTRLDCVQSRASDGGSLSLAPMTDGEGNPLLVRSITLLRHIPRATLEIKPMAPSRVTVMIDPADSNSAMEGHQVELPLRGRTNPNLVTVTVTDQNNSSDQTEYTLEITTPAIQHPPVFTDGDDTTRMVAENSGGSANVGGPVAATDLNTDSSNKETYDGGESLTYSLAGPFNPNFLIHSRTGQLRIRTTLNYEQGNPQYSLTAVVTDATGRTDSIDVTINVTNVDEPGTVTVSPLQFAVGTQITATLSDDPNGGVTNQNWKWYRCSKYRDDTSCIADPITGATLATYTPVDADGSWHLKAKVAYTDAQGAGKTAQYFGGRFPRWSRWTPPWRVSPSAT